MKKFKKIAAAICACVICLSMAPLSSIAAAGNQGYLRGDINGDQKISLLDVGSLNSYLHGQVRSSFSDRVNLEQRLDVNKDNIIDECDLEYLQQISIGDIKTRNEYYSSSSKRLLTPSQSEVYYKIDCKTGNRDLVYQIDPAVEMYDGMTSPYNLPSQFSSSINTVNSCVGDNDDRYLQNALHGVVKTSTGGTAFVVGKHTLLTAAHCFANGKEKPSHNPGEFEYDVAKNVSFTFYNNADEESFKINAKKVHIPEQYFLYNQRAEDDYALVTVDMDLSNYMDFNLGLATNNIKQSNPDVFVTGFGDSDRGLENLNGKRSTGSGKVVGIESDLIHYNADMVGGDSGAPVYVIQGNIRTVIGINTVMGGDNYGKRITPDVLRFVYENPNL